MKILIAATSRNGERFQGRGVEGDGCIYVCDYNKENQSIQQLSVKYLPKPLFIGRDKRLGARGIIKASDNHIFCANHDALFLMDDDLSIKKGISLPSMGDIHDIVCHPTQPHIYVTCSSSDSIQIFDYSLNHIGGWRACDQAPLAKYMNQKHISKRNVPIRFHNRKNFSLHDYRKSFNGDVFHLNSVFWWENSMIVSFSTLAKLFDTTHNQFIDLPFNIENKNNKGGRIHGGIVCKNNLVILNTHHNVIERYNLHSKKCITKLEIHRNNSELLNTNGFLRGMLYLNDNEFLVGQIGPTIFYCNFSTGEVRELINFEKSNQWSIYSIANMQ